MMPEELPPCVMSVSAAIMAGGLEDTGPAVTAGTIAATDEGAIR
jgi:hypothetical protein